MTIKRVQAIISGRVHGVGYRYFATHAAQRLGVVGTVRNIPCGQVEAIGEGDEEALAGFLAELRKGPIKADVTAIYTAWSEPSGEYERFEAIC